MEAEQDCKLMRSALPEMEVTEDALFDGVMEAVGMRGPFQTRFNTMFNLIFVLLVAMPYFNIVLALTVPDHWCHVPGRDRTNLTEEQWKALTIPRKNVTRGIGAYHNCKMYNISWTSSSEEAPFLRDKPLVYEETSCQHGWDYDVTWYSLTAPSQEDWVCDRELLVTNAFVFSRIGEVVGTFVFGQLGDTIGRKPVFFVGIVMLVVGRVVSALSAANYPLFLFAAVFGSIPSSPVFQSPLILGIEVSPSDKRAHIAMQQCLGWTAGMCIMPLIAWATGHWAIFLVLTSLPTGLYIFTVRCFPESPRWLANKGKTARCVSALRHIAKKNGTSLAPDTLVTLQRIAGKKENVYGIASLFSSWRLAKNTALISFTWVIGALVYYTLLLNITNMSGNPFMNFFYQSLVELPGYILGKYFSETIGRRWTQSGTMFVATVAQVAIIFIIGMPNLDWMLMTVVVFVKFVVTVSFYASYLIAMETYPTCVRQSGTSMAAIASSALGVLGPYIVYSGTLWDARYPYIIMAVLTFLGGVAAAFLPETLNQKLPETLKDAQFFGMNQKFWSLLSTETPPKSNGELVKKWIGRQVSEVGR